jgi:ribosomal protein L22
MKIATAKATDARISVKHSIVLCKEIKGIRLESGKKFLQELLDQKKSLAGKYHPTAAKKLIEILSSAEANAKIKNMNTDKLFIKTARANQGYAFYRPRSRYKLRGRRVKATHITIEVEER